MSARFIVVLALVAYVTVLANSQPYGSVKGGQSYYFQDSFKGSYPAQQQWQQPSQQFSEPAQSTAPVVSAPVHVAEAAPVKGQSFYQAEQRVEAPAKVPLAQSTAPAQVYESAPVKSAPGQFYQAEQRLEAPAPVVSQTTQYTAPVTHYDAPVKGQSFYQPEQRHEFAPAVAQSAAPAQVYESAPVKGQATYYQPAQRFESFQRTTPLVAAPTKSFAPAPQFESAPVKGQATYYQPAQRFEAPRVPSVQQHFDSAPVKGAQSYYAQEPLKSQYYPRQDAVVTQQQQPLVSAPAQTTSTLQVEAAPVKGQTFYQAEQRFEAPRAQSAVYETAPVQQATSFKA